MWNGVVLISFRVVRGNGKKDGLVSYIYGFENLRLCKKIKVVGVLKVMGVFWY